MKQLFKKVTSIALLSALVLTGCAGGGNNAAKDNAAENNAAKNNAAAQKTDEKKDGQVVKIGVVGDDQRLWEKRKKTPKKTALPWTSWSLTTTTPPTTLWQTAIST